ncbi:hypothetical protein [Brevibacterium ihuae]|nr:hypothetical protein [Brevibacterium ihuae]
MPVRWHGRAVRRDRTLSAAWQRLQYWAGNMKHYDLGQLATDTVYHA